MSRHTIIGPNGAKPVLAPFRKTLVDAPILGTLPASLTVNSGTATYGSIASTTGYAQVATAATADAQAILYSTDSYQIGQWSMLWAEFDAVRLDGSGLPLDFAVQFRNASSAFGIEQKSTDPVMKTIRFGSAQTDTNIDIRAAAGRGAKNHRFRIGIDFARKLGVYSVGDGKLIEVPLPALTDLSVRAHLSLKTKEAVSHWFRVGGVRVWGEHV